MRAFLTRKSKAGVCKKNMQAQTKLLGATVKLHVFYNAVVAAGGQATARRFS